MYSFLSENSHDGESLASNKYYVDLYEEYQFGAEI